MSLENALLENTAALNNLAELIRGAKFSAPAGSAAPAADANGDTDGKDDPITWANNKTGTFGSAASQAEFDKLKKKDADIVKTTPAQHAKKVKAAEAEAAKKAEADKKKSTASDAPAADKAELVKAAQAFLPKDLDEDLKEERRAFVKGLLDRFGGAKVTEIPEEHWGLTVNLIQRKGAGQDVDPSDAEYEDLEENDDDNLV